MPETFVEALLRNPNRRRLFELLERTPGMNKNQLAVALGIHANALTFHLQRMVQAGIVETRPGWRGIETLCFTTDNAHLWNDEATRVLFGQGPLRQVATYLAEHPGAEVKDVARELGLSPTSIRHHLRILEHRGLIQRMRIDRHVLYHAEPLLEARVAQVGGAPVESGRERG